MANVRNEGPPIDESALLEVLSGMHGLTAYKRILVVLWYCSRHATGCSVDLTWMCGIVERAGYSRPNKTSIRTQLKRERGVSMKGANAHLMSKDKAAQTAVELGLEDRLSKSESASVDLKPSRADVCIVCAIVDPEFEALRKSLGLSRHDSVPHDPTQYYGASVQSSEGSAVDVVAAAATNMGLASSAVLATKMILRNRPRIVIMPGIIGGASGGELGYGDIVVAKQTIDYRSGKISQDAHGDLHFYGSPSPLAADPHLINYIDQSSKEIEVALTGAKKRFDGNVPDSEARLRLGDVASGDQVVSSAKIVAEQLSSWRKLLGVEMETYAVHRACRDAVNPPPTFLSCKAVSDAATDKTSTWRKFAAYMSAEFVRHFLVDHYHKIP